MKYEKRTIKYHPNVDFNKDSVILEEAILGSLEKIQKAAKPLEEAAKAFAKIVEKTQPSKAFLEYLKNIKELTKPSEEAAKAFAKIVVATQPPKEFLEHQKNYIDTLNKLHEALYQADQLNQIVKEREK